MHFEFTLIVAGMLVLAGGGYYARRRSVTPIAQPGLQSATSRVWVNRYGTIYHKAPDCQYYLEQPVEASACPACARSSTKAALQDNKPAFGYGSIYPISEKYER